MIWIMIATFFVLIALGMPVAFAMGSSALLYILVEGVPLEIVAQRFLSNTQSFAFLAVPFFIFMGNLMVEGRIAQRIIDVIHAGVRRLPGGLGCVSVVTSMGMAGVSGSSVADASSVGSVLIPEMKRKGYSASFAAAINASSSVVGIIIPPSSTMIIIAWLADLSVADMFLAGIIPGILIGLAYLALTIVISLRRGYPRGDRPTFKEFIVGARRAFWALLLPIVLIYVIVAGVATPTEAAAIAAVYAFLVSFVIYRTLSLRGLVRAVKGAAYGTTVIMLIVCTSTIFSYVLISERVPQLISDALLGMGLPDWGIKVALVLILLVAGAVMDLVPNLFIFIPIFFPIALELGMDPVHFGIVMLCTLALGLFTPPIGTTLFISCHLAKIRMEQVTKDLVPYFAVGAVVVLLLMFVPALTMWIPELING
ncbi:TRAP transporter large permease [Phytoactinopolyspora limicola]|uniref:TRAP transporter large permease n=1 Tax=Phytoactinopolyspora limicola TaxID=2715536 RepID=UPI001408A3F9|nr:TRAP transporter large permease [Phytoactinopolyspora limicola]